MDKENSTPPEITAQLKEVLSAEAGLKLAIIYGSATNGKLRRDSDLDLAVLFEQPLNAERKINLVQILENSMHRSVDLVDLFDLNGTILKQILCKGEVIIKNDSQAMFRIIQRMIYNQADMMPYVKRALLERQRGFIDGQ